jgi:glutamate carboxypeptidase
MPAETTTAGAGASDAELAALTSAFAAEEPAFLADLERLVAIDSGSWSPAGVDAMGSWVAAFLRDLGATVAVHPDPGGRLGSTVVGIIAGTPGAPRALLIGHLDTVFADGTAAERPFRLAAGRATGPGVTDDKGGLLAGLHALRALARLGSLPFERLAVVANPDEEVGSPSSTPHIRALAAETDVAFVLECARANGDIVSSRKGSLDLELVVSGRAAHSGVEPEKGRSAILEAAHQVLGIHGLGGRWPGVTANVGVIEGGSRANVVAERARLEVDLRATDRRGLQEAEAALRELAAAPTVPDVHVEVIERARHWPMEKLARSGRLVDHARDVARRLGFEVDDAATGGASDANTTAGMGVPTLDGLGPIGGDDHAPSEYLEVASIVPRMALLAGLLLAAGRDPVIVGWRRARGAVA